ASTSGGNTAAGNLVLDNPSAPPPPVAPTLSVGDASFHEGTTSAPGQGTFTVSLSAASAAPVMGQYATADGTAIAGTDYRGQYGTLIFAAGETQKTITIAAIDDHLVTPNQSFSLVLSAASGATLAHGTGSGTVINDDIAPTLSIADASFAEGSAAAPGHGAFT